MPAADHGADRADHGVGAGAGRGTALPALTPGSAISLKIDRAAPPGWELDLRGRWARGADDELRAHVSGTLRGPDLAEPAAGTVTFWPLRIPGGIVIGSRRIALDVTAARGRLVLDGDPGPPPYLMGITLSGRMAGPTGDEDVKIWINPAQLLELWFRLNL